MTTTPELSADCLAIPHHTWEAILEQLDAPSLANFSGTNREFRELASSDLAWRHHYQRDWSCSPVHGAIQAAASVLGAAAKPLPYATPSNALLEAAGAAPGSTPARAPASSLPPALPSWRQLYKVKKETEANWRSGHFKEACLRGHGDYIRCLDLQGCGNRLVSASGSFAEKDCGIRVWDLHSGRCLERLAGHEGPIWSMQPLGERWLASVGDDGTLRFWDFESHRVGVSHCLGPDRVGCVSWDTEGCRLAAANAEGQVAIWSLAALQEALASAEADMPDAAPPGAGSTPGDFPSWQEVPLDPSAPPAMVTTPVLPAGPWPAITCMQLEGGLLFAGEGGRDGSVHVWDASAPSAGFDADAPAPAPRVIGALGPHVKGVSCLASWRRLGALAVGSVSGELKLWDLATNNLMQELRGHKRDILCMQLGDVGCGGSTQALLATGSADKTVRVWDARSGQSVRRLSLPTMPYCLQMSEGRLAAGCSDGNVRLWDLREGSTSCTAGGGSSSGSRPLVLGGHAERVWALVMDETTLISASLDGNIMVRSFLPGCTRFERWATQAAS